MQLREYGNYLRVNLSEDISATLNTLELYPPNSKTPLVIDTAGGLLVGGVDFDTGSLVYTANEYLEYRFKEGDINKTGTWKVVATVLDNGTFRLSTTQKFAVTK